MVQAVRTYLPRTENWIYHQVENVERYRSVFAAKAVANLDFFPFEPVHRLSRSAVHVKLLDRAIQRRLNYSPFFSGIVRKERGRIIHAHGGGIATFVAGTAARLNLPLVVSFYGVDMWKHPDGERGLRQKYADVFRKGSLYLAEGPAAAAQLVRIGCPENRIVIHRLGVDVQRIHFSERRRCGSEIRVLMACRFAEKKGIPYGVEAFCRVARDNPALRLTIVGDTGSPKDARVRKQISEIVGRHRMTQQVEVRGFIGSDELQDLAQQHEILLHPSVTANNGDSEGGHPVVMTMLAATGMPIIATTHCDIPQIVEHGRTGWLVSERNSDELEFVLRSIVADSSLLAEFGRNARALVEERYDSRTMRFDPLYDRVLGEVSNRRVWCLQPGG